MEISNIFYQRAIFPVHNVTIIVPQYAIDVDLCGAIKLHNVSRLLSTTLAKLATYG